MACLFLFIEFTKFEVFRLAYLTFEALADPGEAPAPTDVAVMASSRMCCEGSHNELEPQNQIVPSIVDIHVEFEVVV